MGSVSSSQESEHDARVDTAETRQQPPPLLLVAPGDLPGQSHDSSQLVENSSNAGAMYPSVNTCVHYLKLPEYSSEAVLKERLLAATSERGFHLN